MKKVKIKANAKINLTLDVFSKADGYHPIRSLVSSIDLCDNITLVKRQDCAVRLIEKGIKSDCAVEDNNAVKTAKAFIQKFNVSGVDIYLNKKIPVGGGLGGSSADIAGVLNGMKKLYDITESVTDISDALASDATYMLNGGFAVIEGRGNDVTVLDCSDTIYLLLIAGEKPITAKECYTAFDSLSLNECERTEKAVTYLLNGDYESLCAQLYNGLYKPALTVLPSLEKDVERLKTVGADASLMTGSGSVVYGVFKTEKARNKAYRRLRREYGERLIKSKTGK